MAEAIFKPPSTLDIVDGNISENFKKWKRQMEVYMLASGGSEKEKNIQTNIILHCAGPNVIDVYDQFTWAEDTDKVDPEKVYKKLEEYCNPRKNEVIESHRFWNTNLDDYPSFEHFLTELRKRVESCNFKDNNRMIRDKIVFSSSGKLQELLMREDKLDMDRAIKLCRAYEQSNKHVQEIREKDKPVHRVEESRKEKKTTTAVKTKQEWRMGSSHKDRDKLEKCRYCGYKHEFRKEKCPAWGKRCDKCNGRNHFKSQCQNVNAVEREPEWESGDEFWLQLVEATKRSKVKAKMLVNNNEVDFQIDTGAEINTIQKQFVYKSQRIGKFTRLRMWNKSTVNSLGEANLEVCNPKTGDKQQIKFVIVPNEFDCLLGLQTVQKLNLITINSENFIGKVELDLGDLGETTLKVEDNASPRALPARNIPIAIKTDVKAEIDRLVERGILEPVTVPTEWVSQMAIVHKKNGSLRICIDPQLLNKALVRERYKLPTFDDIIPELNGAKIFTKLDVKEAFYHVRLDDESSLLTTMITPFGRYKWTRLPFGLSVSSEIFQRKLTEALKGIEGIFLIADDLIVAGCGNTLAEASKDNDAKLEKLYARCKDQKIILNEQKKEVGEEIIFHGHKITSAGIQPDEQKVDAILKMPPPENVTDVRRLCGLVQYMGRFLKDLADTLEPIRHLTRKDVKFDWNEDCQRAFESLKKQLTKAPILAYFDPEKELVVQADSSQSGLGAVLLQEGKPIEFTSRSLSESERNWAQIEKESLAVLFGLEKFDQYTYGRKVVIQNDHRPLESILSKPLSQAPKRLQDIIMKLHRYDIDFRYVRGSDLIIADALSRAVAEQPVRPRILQVNYLKDFPDERVTEIRAETEKDAELQKLMKVIQDGWPEKNNMDADLRKYYSIRDTLSVDSNVILKGEAIFIPKTLRKDMLKRLHAAHLGHQSMLRRARGKIFWLGMNRDIQNLAQSCEACEIRKPRNQNEPLLQHEDGNHPWDKVGTDIFMIENRQYLLTIDYFSNFVEVDYLTTPNSKQVIEKLKKQFSRFGSPRVLVSDGGPQYTSNEFQSFVKDWKIYHHICSPIHPKSNGKAEAGVKIVKNMMKKCLEDGTDQYEALLELRNTPRPDTGKSPQEMLFNRPARTVIPGHVPRQPVSQRRQKRKAQIKVSYDKHTRRLPDLNHGQNIYFEHQPRKWMPGRVTKQNNRNYSYVVTSENGVEYRRVREHIRPTIVKVPIRESSPPPGREGKHVDLRDTPLHSRGEVVATEPREQPRDPVHPQPERPEPVQTRTSQPEVSEPIQRPRREHRQPAYLKDYV